MERPSLLKRQDGFTLIEIIAVLVLLGILAAVAVPKYISLQDEAELKAVQAVKAELNARANQYFAQYLLDPTAANAALNAQVLADWAAEDLGGDFTLAAGTGAVDVNVGSSTNTFSIAFTVGVSATDDTGTPAVFGAISGP